ncbi:11680_t:CDS:1, partial [Diversispora eburnea]
MNSKFISFVLSIFTLSIYTLSAVSAVAHPNIYRSSSELFKRTHEKNDTCPCTLATATFCGPVVWGEVVFAQDEYGKTVIAGLFSDGLVDPEKNCYKYLIVDKCDKVLYDFTEEISPKYRKNGTWPFISKRLDDLILNCDEEGVLFAYCDNCTDTHCKREEQGQDVKIINDDGDYFKAPLDQ